MDDCHQVSPRTGKRLEATQGTRKVPRLREKRDEKGKDLVGGFKYFLFSPLPEEIIQFDPPWSFLYKMHGLEARTNDQIVRAYLSYLFPTIILYTCYSLQENLAYFTTIL